jgi:hypothetical protein
MNSVLKNQIQKHTIAWCLKGFLSLSLSVSLSPLLNLNEVFVSKVYLTVLGETGQ